MVHSLQSDALGIENGTMCMLVYTQRISGRRQVTVADSMQGSEMDKAGNSFFYF